MECTIILATISPHVIQVVELEQAIAFSHHKAPWLSVGVGGTEGCKACIIEIIPRSWMR